MQVVRGIRIGNRFDNMHSKPLPRLAFLTQQSLFKEFVLGTELKEGEIRMLAKLSFLLKNVRAKVMV